MSHPLVLPGGSVPICRTVRLLALDRLSTWSGRNAVLQVELEGRIVIYDNPFPLWEGVSVFTRVTCYIIIKIAIASEIEQTHPIKGAVI